MANITVQRDPACITNVERHQFNGPLVDWLTANEQFNFGGLHAHITLNGRTIINTAEMTPEQCDDAAQTVVGEGDNVLIIIRPQGLDPFTLAVIVFVAAVAVSYIAFSQLIPNLKQDQGEGAGSNNQLNSASNDYRPWGAVADIAGQIVSYPDFVQLSYYTYNSAGRREFREIFVVGVGYYDEALIASTIKDGETKLSDIGGSSVVIHGPGSTPSGLLNVRAVQNAEGVDLVAPNVSSNSANINSGSVNMGEFFVGTQIMSQLAIANGDSVYVQLTTIDGEGIITDWDTTYTVVSTTASSFTVATGTIDGDILSGVIVNNSFTAANPWYTLEGDAITEVRFHLRMPTGIRKGDGSLATVTVTLQAEKLDGSGNPTGVVYTRAASFAGNTQQGQFATFVINSDFGMTPGSYRAKVTRVTNSLGDNALDLLQLERLESVTPYSADFGFVTSLDVRRVTPPAGGAARSSNKINCVAQRLLRVYDHGTGVYSTDYTATRRFCDYVFYVLHEQMQVPIANINTEQLFGIHDNLSDAQLGLFDYSFDDKNTEARERIKAACNAARVAAWEDGQVWSFVRDEAKPVSVAHFDRRNTIGGQAQYEHSFRLPSDYDSVSLRYVDPDKNVQKVISKRINSAGAIVDGAGSRPLEFELIGCRNLAQAMNRLNLEIRRLIYQRVQVTDTVIMDALTVGKWQRVSWSDVWDGQTFDGEILDVVGNVYSTSERFEPEIGVEYWVYITDVNGNPSNTVRAYPRADGNIYGFEATGLTGAYLKTGTQQLGSRYFIATTADMTNSLFLLDGRGRPNERGETSVTLIEYNQEMYEAD